MKKFKQENAQNEYEKMISKAIENASKLGIDVYHPHFNSANGNCAFESVIDNINSRPCFDESYTKSPDYYRAVWMSEIEEIGFGEWNMGLSENEWHEGWSLIKKSRAYEHRLGDLVVPGIAHATRKNIIIFNTFPQAYPPVYVVSASVFGRSPTTDIPVCLAYNKVHFEQLVPNTNNDIISLTELSKKLLNGNTVDELNFFNVDKVPNMLSKYDENFPPLSLATNNKGAEQLLTKKSINCCSMTLLELKQIPVKQRTKEQQSRYKNLMYLQSREKLSGDQLEEKRKQNRDQMKKARKIQDEKSKGKKKEEDRQRMKDFHNNLDDEKKNKEK